MLYPEIARAEHSQRLKAAARHRQARQWARAQRLQRKSERLAQAAHLAAARLH